MKRREFIALLGGAAAAWPLAARAQQREHMRRIGVLWPLAADDPISQARNAAFLQALQQLGWTVGQNIQIEYRWSAGNDEAARRFAAELAALAPEVILASGSAAAGPLLQVTRTVPIVFAIVPDPVGAGFVDSLARPGGNATGFVNGGDRPVGRHTDGGAVARVGGEPAQRPRRRRDRARHHGVRAFLEWRLDRDGKCIVQYSSQTDHHTGGPLQTARRLFRAILRHCWRADLLRA